jgi:hypothetical protein
MSKRRAASGVVRPAGMGRHALLIESSIIEEGRRWFEMSQIKRLMLIQRRRSGRREMAKKRDGVVVVVRSGPESAVEIAKSVCGIVMHLMLEHWKRYSVERW